ncbi:hypothetical protein SAMN05192560_0683 [Methylobacillus rhizosphaerae]|uniref:Secreted protein n=2 Tax=Methylobacillus rhizosphaerae TaxID=551994 RepID=A0A238YKH3_9PROT|nr:hypothetical protein SAMN05192560_0683 [Methylobacillus rhizosphaerae]
MKIPGLLLSMSMIVLAPATYAADTAVDAPPVHQQKQDMPDSTEHGDYLEPQDQSTQGEESSRDGASSGNAQEKSKRFEQEPEQGGTEVHQQPK